MPAGRVYWLQKEKGMTLSPEHGRIVRNGDIHDEIAATTGTDGMLHVLKLHDDPDKLEQIRMDEISDNIEKDSPNQLPVKWSPNGTILAIGGGLKLRIIVKDNWDNMDTIEEIAHETPISQITWINDNIVATC
jgi:WD40 repeat protein